MRVERSKSQLLVQCLQHHGQEALLPDSWNRPLTTPCTETCCPAGVWNMQNSLLGLHSIEKKKKKKRRCLVPRASSAPRCLGSVFLSALSHPAFCGCASKCQNPDGKEPHLSFRSPPSDGYFHLARKPTADVLNLR